MMKRNKSIFDKGLQIIQENKMPICEASDEQLIRQSLLFKDTIEILVKNGFAEDEANREFIQECISIHGGIINELKKRGYT